jgi:hypothetical protein
VEEMVAGDPIDRLERDRATFWLRSPLTTDTTSSWYRLHSSFDP